MNFLRMILYCQDSVQWRSWCPLPCCRLNCETLLWRPCLGLSRRKLQRELVLASLPRLLTRWRVQLRRHRLTLSTVSSKLRLSLRNFCSSYLRDCLPIHSHLPTLDWSTFVCAHCSQYEWGSLCIDCSRQDKMSVLWEAEGCWFWGNGQAFSFVSEASIGTSRWDFLDCVRDNQSLPNRGLEARQLERQQWLSECLEPFSNVSHSQHNDELLYLRSGLPSCTSRVWLSYASLEFSSLRRRASHGLEECLAPSTCDS